MEQATTAHIRVCQPCVLEVVRSRGFRGSFEELVVLCAGWA